MSQPNEKLRRIEWKKTRALLVAAGVLAVCLLLLYAAASSAYFMRHIYRPFSRTVLYGLSKAAGLVPFSVAEWLLYILVVVVLAAVVRLIVTLVRGPRRLAALARFGAWAALVAVLFASVFTALWGLNYRAEPLAAQLALTVEPRSETELVALCSFLAEESNALAVQVERDDDGKLRTVQFGELAETVASVFSAHTGRNEERVKYVVASKPMSYTYITGIFIPFTGEANVNTNNTMLEQAFCMAHETAHRYGVAREGEANFYAFYVLFEAEVPLLRYSAYVSALIYAQNRLYEANQTAYRDVQALYGAELRNDLNIQSAHWAQYEGPVSDIAASVNDAYLTVQQQPGGVQSYGRMVDLLLAWYAAR